MPELIQSAYIDTNACKVIKTEKNNSNSIIIGQSNLTVLSGSKNIEMNSNNCHIKVDSTGKIFLNGKPTTYILK